MTALMISFWLALQLPLGIAVGRLLQRPAPARVAMPRRSRR